MSYSRPKSELKLSPNEKRELIQEYFDYYKRTYIENPELLNSKIPRDAFNDLLDAIGELLFEKSKEFANSPGQVSDFLNSNPLPEHIDGYLPREFRAFCLALNALKQWVSAEQAATDRYIFGGTVRKLCRDTGKTCLVTGVDGTENTLELHHPVRDGRPPVLLSKETHALIERQSSASNADDEVMTVIRPIKRQGNRSWVMLKLGCELLLGIEGITKSKNVQASSKTFARKASKESGLNYQELLDWIADNNLVD